MKSTTIAKFALGLAVGVEHHVRRGSPHSAAMGLRIRRSAASGSHASSARSGQHGSDSAQHSRRHGAILARPDRQSFRPGRLVPRPNILRCPAVVAHGKQPDVWACGLCHYPNGKGRAENAGVSGLSVEYFIHTMNDFKAGNRKSADPRKNNTNLMQQFAQNMSDDEIKAAAEYFGAMKWTPWIKVVEAKMVPKTKPSNGLFIVEGTEMEPLGNRIVETPVNGEATEILRDPHSSFTAYVPFGAVKKGEVAGHQRRRENNRLRHLPWRRSERHRSGATSCRPVAQLSDAPDVRHAAGFPQRIMDRADEAGGGAPDYRRHDEYRSIRGFANALM